MLYDSTIENRMKLNTFGPVHNDTVAIRDSIRKALEQCDEKPQLAVIYPSISSDIQKIVNLIHSEIDVQIVGASSGGAVFTERGVSKDGVVGGFIGGRGVTIQTVAIKKTANVVSDLRLALESIQPAAGGGHSLFVLADPLAIDGDNLTHFLSDLVPLNWRILGGFAGDNWKFVATKIIHNETVFSGGIVIAYINDQLVPGVGIRHGFHPIEGGREMIVTAIEGNILKELDGKPAASVYIDELKELGLIQAGQDILPLLAEYSIGVKTILGEKWKIRTPMSLHAEHITLAGSIPAQSRVRIMRGDDVSLMHAARDVANLATERLKSRRPGAQLVVDCAIRLRILGDRYGEYIDSIRADSECPMLGFASYGELARYGGSLEGFHNATAISAVW